jgi:4-amino-4-deoxy-L-arabinose transferase-like glycosyltransferase
VFARLVGHDPWKPDEAYTFGLVRHMLETGDWVTPALADEPFIEKPPLFSLTAALFATVLSPALPSHRL